MKTFHLTLMIVLLGTSSMAQVSELKDSLSGKAQPQRYILLQSHECVPDATLIRIHESGVDSVAFHNSLEYYRTMYHLALDSSLPALVIDPLELNKAGGMSQTPPDTTYVARVRLWQDQSWSNTHRPSRLSENPATLPKYRQAVDFEKNKLLPFKK